MTWISQSVSHLPPPIPIPNHSMAGIVVGLLTNRTSIDATSARTLAQMTCHLIQNGCVVVIPEFDKILSTTEFVTNVFDTNVELRATILNAEQVDPNTPGVHIMRTSGPHDYVETVTSLAATGASAIFVFSDCVLPLPGHPFVPTIRVGSHRVEKRDLFDAVIEEGEKSILNTLTRILSRELKTKVTMLDDCKR